MKQVNQTLSADRYGIFTKTPPSKNLLASVFVKSSASAPSYTKHLTALRLLA